MKFNIYEVTINHSGYVRTKNDLTGNIEFEESFEIKGLYPSDVSLKIKDLEIGKNVTTYVKSDFDMDFLNDEIIRDDTFETISMDIKHHSYYFFIKTFETFFNKFPLKISNKDKKQIRKNLFKTRNIEDISFDSFNNEVWNFLDNKYFLPNKIRFNVKNINLNGIKVETLFNKFLSLIEFTEFSFYKNEVKGFSNLIKILNKVINKEDNQLIQKEEIEIKNKTKTKTNKNKVENIIKIKKIDYIKDLKKTLSKNNIECKFELIIKLK